MGGPSALLLCRRSLSMPSGMSLLPAPVTSPQSRPRLNLQKPATAVLKRCQSAKSLLSTSSPSSCRSYPNSDSQDFGWYSRSARPLPLLHRKKSLSVDAVCDDDLFLHFNPALPLPTIPSVDNNTVHDVDGTVVVGLAQRVQELASQVLKMERERDFRCEVEDDLRRELHNLAAEKATLRGQITSLQEVVRSSSRRMNDCVDASAAALDTERGLRRDVEARARRAEDRIGTLLNENAVLTQAKARAERETAQRVADAKAWQNKIRAMQHAQERAMENLHKVEDLEKENYELKTAMHAFARGSTEMIVLQLELMIDRMRTELDQYKQQEEESKIKGKENVFRRRESRVLEEMRQNTNAIKRRSQDNTDVSHAMIIADRPISTTVMS